MREFTDSTVHRHGDTAPCAVCRQPCSLYIDDVCVHLLCWKSTDAATTAQAQQAAAIGEPCLGCGKPTTTRYGGRPLHPTCDITPAATAHRVAAPAKPAAPDRTPAPAAPTTRPAGRSQTTTAGPRPPAADRPDGPTAPGITRLS